MNECGEPHPVAAVAWLEVAGSDGGEHIGGRPESRGRWHLNECGEPHPVAWLEVARSDGGEHIGGRPELGVSANGDAGHGRAS